MSILRNMFRVTRRIVELPISVVKDVATLGMRSIHEGQTFTGKKLDEIEEEL